MKLKVATALQAFGIAAISGGVALIWIPAGVIIAGAGLVLFGVAVEREATRQRP